LHSARIAAASGVRKGRLVNILDAIRDPKLFGASSAFADLAKWRPWLAFLRVVYGLPLDADSVDLFKRCTGRST
jgi:hypothetical protein